MRRLMLAVVLAAAVTLAAVGSATAKTQMVPIKASLSGHLVADSEPADCGLIPDSVAATGEMSHLGRIDIDIHVSHCEVTAPTQMVLVGTGVVHAANGDELYLEWGHILDLTTGAFTFSRDDIVGGTGRFAHATGSLTGAGTFDLSQGTGVWSVAGTISTVGSK